MLFVLLAAFFLFVPVHPDRNALRALIAKKALKAKKVQWPKFKYRVSYRDHVYYEMSNNTKSMFFAVATQPSCKAKQGRCIRRGECINREMLYLSRGCFTRDLVCCYDRYPEYISIQKKGTDEEKIEAIDEKNDKDEVSDPNKAENDNSTKVDDTPLRKGKRKPKKPLRNGKSKPKKQVLRTEEGGEDFDDLEDYDNPIGDVSAIIVMPEENGTHWSWSLVSNVTKEDILKTVNSTAVVQELNFTTLLQSLPELIPVLDNIPEQHGLAPAPNLTTIRTTDLNDEEPRAKEKVNISQINVTTARVITELTTKS